jgi:hypothetical protein
VRKSSSEFVDGVKRNSNRRERPKADIDEKPSEKIQSLTQDD